MSSHFGWYALVALSAALAAYLLTPAMIVLAWKFGAVKVPRDRDVHKETTPEFGGPALVAAVFVALGVALLTPLRVRLQTTETLGFVVGGAIALVLGTLDDRRELGWKTKAAGQVLAAGALYLSGTSMSYFWLPVLGVLSLDPNMSLALTVVVVLLLMNAVNWIDGLDGLAAGLSAIASFGFLFYTLRLEQAGLLGPYPIAPVTAIAVVGACIGFLRYNFNPARIFMGDSGSNPLGFFIAAATISVVGRSTTAGPETGRLALPLITTPIVFLALPLWDVAFAVVRRLAKGQPPFSTADKEHTHHRLMRLGHSQRQAVLVMYAWAAMLAGFMVVAGVLSWGKFALAFAVAVGTIVVFTASPRWRKGGDNGINEASTDVAVSPSAS